MEWGKVSRETEGLHTVESFSEALGIGRQTAVNYLHSMRKEGFVETTRGPSGKRLYRIEALPLRKEGHPGLIEVIGRNSGVKLYSSAEERSDHEISVEEAIARAAASGDFRVVLASLPLFRKVSDWKELYRQSRERGVARQVGALYCLARMHMRVKSADMRTLSVMKRSKAAGRFIVEGMRSADFSGLEKDWGVGIPFNRADLQRLGNGRQRRRKP
jgi:predicted transcriptional regulator